MTIELNLDCVYEEVKESIIAIVWNNAQLGRTTEDTDIVNMTNYPKKFVTDAITRMTEANLVKRV